MRVLITGANRGIGRALYDGYVARGDDVTPTTRTQTSNGWLRQDVTDPASVSAMCVSLLDFPIEMLRTAFAKVSACKMYCLLSVPYHARMAYLKLRA